MLLGAGGEALAEAADARAYPPPGQLVDVGGHRLHLHCVGTGSPTVVVDAGLGDWSASWSSRVQPDAARTTRVCTNDRAGLGWSDVGPLPRTAGQVAHELHTLLRQARVSGPYVLWRFNPIGPCGDSADRCKRGGEAGAGRAAASQAAFLTGGYRAAGAERRPLGRPGQRPQGFGAAAMGGSHRASVAKLRCTRAGVSRAGGRRCLRLRSSS